MMIRRYVEPMLDLDLDFDAGCDEGIKIKIKIKEKSLCDVGTCCLGSLSEFKLRTHILSAVPGTAALKTVM